MKTNSLVTKILTGSALVLFSVALPSAYAGPGSGVSIWRDHDKKAPAVVAPASTENRVCTDARVVSVKQTTWARNGGRGPVITTTGEKLVCGACAVPVASAKTADRNSNGPKATWANKATHDCSRSGCGSVATVAVVLPRS